MNGKVVTRRKQFRSVNRRKPAGRPCRCGVSPSVAESAGGLTTVKVELNRSSWAANAGSFSTGSAPAQIDLQIQVPCRICNLRKPEASEVPAATKKNPRRQGENSPLTPPFKTLTDDLPAPDMLSKKRFNFGRGIQPFCRHHFRQKRQSQNVRRGKMRGDFVITKLRGGDDGIALLMKQGGEKQET